MDLWIISMHARLSLFARAHGLPCEFVSSCDDALSLHFGFEVVEGGCFASPFV